MGRSTAAFEKPQKRRSKVQGLLALLSRLQDPKDVQAAAIVAFAILVFEAGICPLIIAKIPYTELDWVAYMQEVEGFMKGERDYRELKGQTGPLVYPAGFVYIFAFLHKLTGGGDVAAGQAAFTAIYILTQAVVLWLYVKAQVVPPWALPLLALSKRVHSIFILRLFNDCIAMLLAYIATGLLVMERWRAAIVMYSAAVSVKMNVLLMAPSVLIVLLKGAQMEEIVEGACQGVALQMLLGAPFLLHNAGAYFGRAFELSRVFQHVWSVNLKFLPENVFQSKEVAVVLLLAHVLLLWAFAQYRWCRVEGGVVPVLMHNLEQLQLSFQLRQQQRQQRRQHRSKHVPRPGSRLRAKHVLCVVFSGNFIGIVCARTLHYQFYSWYFHTVPLLLWCTRLPTAAKLSMWLAIEVIFNIFPSTASSSLALLGCHAVLLFSLWALPDKEAEIAQRKSAPPRIVHNQS